MGLRLDAYGCNAASIDTQGSGPVLRLDASLGCRSPPQSYRSNHHRARSSPAALGDQFLTRFEVRLPGKNLASSMELISGTLGDKTDKIGYTHLLPVCP